MATKIRLKRIGRRNRPFYRLIVIDSRKKRDGAAIEQIGWYNPIDNNNSYEINDERILHWLGEGAIPSNAVKKIMKREGLTLRWHLMQQGVDEKEIEKEVKKWELNRENVLASREAKQAEKLAKKKEKSQSSEASPEAEVDKPAEDAGGDELEASPEAEVDKPAEDAGGDELEASPEAEVDKPAEEEPSDDAGEEE